MCSRYLSGALSVLLSLALVACEREERRFTESAGASQAPNAITQSELQPGARTVPAQGSGPYQYNADAINRGKQLYEWFNCSGCHAQGGGAIGPPLMDDLWIYGSAPENIFATIVQGRPNGMPSFREKIPNAQVWQIVAYVLSMSGQVSKDVAPSRSDHLFMKKSEQSTAVAGSAARQSSPPPPTP